MVVIGRTAEHLGDVEGGAEVVAVDEAMTKGDTIDGTIGIVTGAVVDMMMTTVAVVAVAGGVEVAVEVEAAEEEDMAAVMTETDMRTEAEVMAMADHHLDPQALLDPPWDMAVQVMQPMDMERRLHRQLLP